MLTVLETKVATLFKLNADLVNMSVLPLTVLWCRRCVSQVTDPRIDAQALLP
jgi:hypothetical protein